MLRFLKRTVLIILTAAPIALIAACADSPTSPVPSTVSELKPKAFLVCAFGEWQADGTCSGSVEQCFDHTFQSGAFCDSEVVLCSFDCGDGGNYGGGYYPPVPDTFDPDPSGECDAFNSESNVVPDSSAVTCSGDFLPMVVKAKSLWGCPSAAAGNMPYLGTTFFPQGVIAFTLSRQSDIRNKSWGGKLRYGVASPNTVHLANFG